MRCRWRLESPIRGFRVGRGKGCQGDGFGASEVWGLGLNFCLVDGGLGIRFRGFRDIRGLGRGGFFLFCFFLFFFRGGGGGDEMRWDGMGYKDGMFAVLGADIFHVSLRNSNGWTWSVDCLCLIMKFSLLVSFVCVGYVLAKKTVWVGIGDKCWGQDVVFPIHCHVCFVTDLLRSLLLGNANRSRKIGRSRSVRIRPWSCQTRIVERVSNDPLIAKILHHIYAG